MGTADLSHSDLSPGLNYAGFSDRGRVREVNEDAFSLPEENAVLKRKGALLALADGVGGLPGGQAAAREAASQLQALFYARTGPHHPADRLREAFEGVNALNLLARDRLGLERGYLTTLVAVLILDEQVWVANVGDSRAYHIRSALKKSRRLTEDHSGHIRMVKAGLLAGEGDPGEAKFTITRAIGLSMDPQVDIYHYTWDPGDVLVLCSDGLAALSDADLVEPALVRPPAAAARALVTRAIQMDGSDNATAVVAHRDRLP